ncbi:hypothetical protein BB558_004048 [Smittium angustum]|uniref:Uncharacterized protein n=1 Tax=Smittium angustum TaxID=133377 RepID=A0A2U1J4H6_SMIAN|nr:hypothetical protein BB558_004048 [Smittium angustum]
MFIRGSKCLNLGFYLARKKENNFYRESLKNSKCINYVNRFNFQNSYGTIVTEKIQSKNKNNGIIKPDHKLRNSISNVEIKNTAKSSKHTFKILPIRKKVDPLEIIESRENGLNKLSDCIDSGEMEKAIDIASSMKKSKVLQFNTSIPLVVPSLDIGALVYDEKINIIEDIEVLDMLIETAKNCHDTHLLFYFIRLIIDEFESKYDSNRQKMNPIILEKLLNVLTNKRFYSLPTRVYCGNKGIILLNHVGYKDLMEFTGYPDTFLASLIRIYGYSENGKKILYINKSLVGNEISTVLKAELVIALVNTFNMKLAKNMLLLLMKSNCRNNINELGLVVEAVRAVSNGMSELGYLNESLRFWETSLLAIGLTSSDVKSVGIDNLTTILQFYVNVMKCLVPFKMFSERFHNSATLKALKEGCRERIYSNSTILEELKSGWVKLITMRNSVVTHNTLELENELEIERRRVIFHLYSHAFIVFPDDFTQESIQKQFDKLGYYQNHIQADYILILWICALYSGTKISSLESTSWCFETLSLAISQLREDQISNKLFLPAMVAALPPFFKRNHSSSYLSSEEEISRVFAPSTMQVMHRSKQPKNKNIMHLAWLTSSFRTRWSRQMHFVFMWSCCLSYDFERFISQYEILNRYSQNSYRTMSRLNDHYPNDIKSRIKDEWYYLNLFWMCSNSFNFAHFALSKVYQDLKKEYLTDKPEMEHHKPISSQLTIAILNCCSALIKHSYSVTDEQYLDYRKCIKTSEKTNLSHHTKNSNTPFSNTTKANKLELNEALSSNESHIKEDKSKSLEGYFVDTNLGKSLKEEMRELRSSTFDIVLDLISRAYDLNIATGNSKMEEAVIRCCFSFQISPGNLLIKRENDVLDPVDEKAIVGEGEQMLANFVTRSGGVDSENLHLLSRPTFIKLFDYYRSNYEKLVNILNIYVSVYLTKGIITPRFFLEISHVLPILEQSNLNKLKQETYNQTRSEPNYFEIQICSYLVSSLLEKYFITNDKNNFDMSCRLDTLVLESLSKSKGFLSVLSTWEVQAVTVAKYWVLYLRCKKNNEHIRKRCLEHSLNCINVFLSNFRDNNRNTKKLIEDIYFKNKVEKILQTMPEWANLLNTIKKTYTNKNLEREIIQCCAEKHLLYLEKFLS